MDNNPNDNNLNQPSTGLPTTEPPVAEPTPTAEPAPEPAPGLSSEVSSDDPYFSSTNLFTTKAHSNTQYFTNVQKASIWQRLSDWITKVNRDSLERSAARKAAMKAKREERRRAADLAAISAAVPDLASLQKKGQPLRPDLAAAFAARAKAAEPTTTTAPATQPASGQPTAPADGTTVIIENGPTPTKKSEKIAVAILSVILVALIVAIIIVLINP